MKTIKFTLAQSSESLETIVNETCVVLERGGVVLSPTDTVMGLFADATNRNAVDTLISIKDRPAGKPISVFVSNLESAEKLAVVGNNRDLLSQILPGKFTVVLPSRNKVDLRLESEKKTIGIRVPDFLFIKMLCEKFGKPITATSANISGKSPCLSSGVFISSLSTQKAKQISLVIDAGTLPRSKPSTVIDLSGDRIKTLRMGEGIFSVVKEVESTSEQDTYDLGFELAQSCLDLHTDGVTFLLQGELGAGKTIFAKGVGKALGVNRVTSPTYIVVAEHPTQVENISRFIHADLFGLTDEVELDNIGLFRGNMKKTFLCIEWSEKMGKLIHTALSLKQPVYVVRLEKKGMLLRTIQVISLKKS